MNFWEKNGNKVLPFSIPGDDLSNRFAVYFEEKIERIYNSFSGESKNKYVFFPDFPFIGLKKFEPVTYEELQRTIREKKDIL